MVSGAAFSAAAPSAAVSAATDSEYLPNLATCVNDGFAFRNSS